ncbi:putative papain-like cysteine peptidase superfamily [Helianthus debilis subsp. tardiflorus]
MAVYALESGANIRVKLVWINARCPRQPGGTECGYYVMKFMKEIAYEGVEILDNDNVGKGVEEYSAADMDGIREDWSTYAVNSIFREGLTYIKCYRTSHTRRSWPWVITHRTHNHAWTWIITHRI